MKNFNLFFLLIIFFIILIPIFNFTVDDAFISFRYAKNLINSHGLVWNIDSEPVEGYSNFLYVIILSPLYLIDNNLIITSKIIGLLSLLFVIYVFWKIIKLTDNQNKHALFFASLFLLINPSTAIHSISGLETMLFGLLNILNIFICYKIFLENKKINYALFCITNILLSLLRPEGIVISASLYLLLLIMGVGKRKYIFYSGLMLGILYTIYNVFRIVYFKELVPNPFYIKVIESGFLAGLQNSIDVIKYIIPFLIIAFLPVLFYKEIKEYKYLFLIVLISFVANGILHLFIRPVMNYSYRFHYPSFIPVYLLSGMSLSYLFRRLNKAFVYILVLLLLFVNVINLAGGLAYIDKYGERLPYSHIALGKTLKNFSDLTIASEDAGAIPYFSDAKHIDIVGLNDKYIAKNGVTYDYIEKQKPDVIILIMNNLNESISEKFKYRQEPFMRYIINNNYTKSYPIMWLKDYYLIPYIKSDMVEINSLNEEIKKISIKSLF